MDEEEAGGNKQVEGIPLAQYAELAGQVCPALLLLALLLHLSGVRLAKDASF